MQVQVTYDDPEVLTKPLTISVAVKYAADSDMLEYVCNEDEQDTQHLVGTAKAWAHPRPELLAEYVGEYKFREGPAGAKEFFGPAQIVSVFHGQLYMKDFPADGKPNLSAPVPRTPDGKPELSGLWEPETSPYRFDVIQDVKDESVFRPEAEALFLKRAVVLRLDNPVTHCLPAGSSAIFASGATRLYRIIQSPKVIGLLYELSGFRQIYTDGRPLPALAEKAVDNFLAAGVS